MPRRRASPRKCSEHRHARSVDAGVEAEALSTLGTATLGLHGPAPALELLHQALRLGREIGYRRGEVETSTFGLAGASGQPPAGPEERRGTP